MIPHAEKRGSAHSPPRARHRGTVYLVALTTAMIVTVMGVSGLLAVRLQHRTAQLDQDMVTARLHARSAAELAMWRLLRDPDWAQLTESQRTRHEPGGPGSRLSFTYRAWDDTPLGASACVPVWIEATGVHGEARAMLTLLAEPVPASQQAHAAALHSLVPLAYWPLDEAAGSTAADRVNNRDGVYERVDRHVHDPAHCVIAAGFDGSNSYVQVPHDDAFLADSGAIVAHFRTEDVNRPQAIFSKNANDTSSGGHLTLRIDNARLVARLTSNVQSYEIQSGPIEEYRWHHVVFAFGQGGMRLYLDGELVASHAYSGGLGRSSGGTGNIEPIAIGADGYRSTTGTFDRSEDSLRGQLFDIAFFTYALSAEQVRELHQAARLDRRYRVAAMGWRDRVE